MSVRNTGLTFYETINLNPTKRIMIMIKITIKKSYEPQSNYE